MSQLSLDDQKVVKEAHHLHDKIEAVRSLRKKISAILIADDLGLIEVDLPNGYELELLEKYYNVCLKFYDSLQVGIYNYKVVPSSMFIVLKEYIKSMYILNVVDEVKWIIKIFIQADWGLA